MEQRDVNRPLTRLQIISLIVGVFGVAAWASGFSLGGATREQFFQSYLFAFLFWIGLPLGGLAVLMLQYLTGGKWGFLIRRMLEAAALTLPIMALVFIPIVAVGMQDLYSWASPDALAHDETLIFKYPYLNTSSFVYRAVTYFVIWIVWTAFLVLSANQQDRTGKISLSSRFRNLSGPGMVLYVITMTFAAFDWGMSLEPHWYSAIYGVVFMIGQGLATFAFVIMISSLIAKRKPFSEVASTKLYHDLGNLLFGFTILWAYMSLSQFIIIWSGNLPAETPWYIHRMADGWNGVAILVLLVQFVLPFFLLLNRFIKRKIEYLWKVALVIFIMRAVDLFWIVLPAFDQALVDVHWIIYVAPVAMGGLWIFLFATILKMRPIVPLRDPRAPLSDTQMQEALGHG
jgi:hypothetical protein